MKNKDKNRKRLWLKILLVLFFIIILSIITFYIFINQYLNKIKRVPENIETIPPEQEYFETDPPPVITSNKPLIPTESDKPDTPNNPTEPIIEETKPYEVVWEEIDEIPKDKNVINILLIGQDRREGEPRARSDSMIILTIDKNEKTLKMTSILRDLYVQIPGYSDNRINSSYAWGGMHLLNETIKKNFGIQIDRNIEVDFTAFSTVINKVGGINITLTPDEAAYLNEKGYTVSAGPTYMNGKLALEYARIRYIDSDFYRSNRQRTVLQSIFNKLKNQSITKWYELTNEIFPLLTTDMSNNEIISYVYTIYGMSVSSIESYRIPTDNGYSPQYVRNMAVLVPNLQRNRDYIFNNIYN